jgi:hypothetical protein
LRVVHETTPERVGEEHTSYEERASARRVATSRGASVVVVKVTQVSLLA